jgi:hypothetical protein
MVTQNFRKNPKKVILVENKGDHDLRPSKVGKSTPSTQEIQSGSASVSATPKYAWNWVQAWV